MSSSSCLPSPINFKAERTNPPPPSHEDLSIYYSCTHLPSFLPPPLIFPVQLFEGVLSSCTGKCVAVASRVTFSSSPAAEFFPSLFTSPTFAMSSYLLQPPRFSEGDFSPPPVRCSKSPHSLFAHPF